MRTLALAAAAAPASAHGTSYRSADGAIVHAPYREAHAGETAVCRDGWHSMSHRRAGTCSGHGGVAQFER